MRGFIKQFKNKKLDTQSYNNDYSKLNLKGILKIMNFLSANDIVSIRIKLLIKNFKEKLNN